MYGYHNRLAWIDLTRRQVDVRPIEARDADDFVGGGNLGAAILARLTDAGTDPLSPDNPLIFMTGPFSGTRALSGSRHEVISLSPLTGIYGESNCGGSFGRQLKRSGFDGLVITGAADKPVVVVIDGEEVTFREAGDLWGLDTYVSDDRLTAELGKGLVTALIGPAGEKLVNLACISHDGRHTRVAGRTGMGAVMGSKKLKGIAVTRTGALDTPVADPEGLKASTRQAMPGLKERLGPWSLLGTTNAVLANERLGNLPINNFRDARVADLAEKTTGTVIEETIQVKRSGCKVCPIICSRVVEVGSGKYATDGVVEGPEYETLASFGSLQLNDDLHSIAKANELCNRLGLDTISVGMVIAFANECYEKGVLTKSDTGGLELGFGRPDVIIELVERIAYARDDLGRVLGQGSRLAAQDIGRGAAEYSMEVKGLELAMHDPRFSWGHAISYATGNRGACHLTSNASVYENATSLPELGYDAPYPHRQREGKAQHTIHLQDLMNLLDSLICCKMDMIRNGVSITDFLDWYNLISGRGLGVDEFMAIGARGFALKRMINNRRGISRKDDVLPPRMRTLNRIGEDVNFEVPPLNPLLSDYYTLRGWTEEGRPGPQSISQLGLDDWARELAV